MGFLYVEKHFFDEIYGLISRVKVVSRLCWWNCKILIQFNSRQFWKQSYITTQVDDLGETEKVGFTLLRQKTGFKENDLFK